MNDSSTTAATRLTEPAAYLAAHQSKRTIIEALTRNPDVANLTNEEARTLAALLSREVTLFLERN